jgi:diguanylate cyclase (GGDEF)-like protein/PAS domain S-box-containing protein
LTDHLPAELLLEFMYLAPVGIVSFRADGTIELMNPAAAQVLMPITQDADLLNLYQVLSGAMPDLQERVASHPASFGPIYDHLRLAVPHSRTVLALSINKIDPDRLTAAIQDISAAVAQETRIRNDQQRLAAIFDNVRDYAIYTVDVEGRIESWNRSLERIGGWQPSDIAGLSMAAFFPAADGAQGLALLDRAARCGTAEVESWRLRKDGSRFWGNSVATAIPDPDGQPSGYLIVTRDMTERKQMEDRLLEISLTDPLTGAANRRAGEARIEEAFRTRERGGQGFSLLMIDCDYFKRINDRWGHDTGDGVLIALVRCCQKDLRKADMIVRWGGEEFLVLLPASDCDLALAVAERLRLAVAATVIGRDAIKVTVSIGVATGNDLDASSRDTIRRVDLALYEAKSSGRNRVVGEQGMARQ